MFQKVTRLLWHSGKSCTFCKCKVAHVFSKIALGSRFHAVVAGAIANFIKINFQDVVFFILCL